MTDLDTRKSEEIEQETDDPVYSHIIDRGNVNKSVQALIFEARIDGTPLTALCGYTWVPSRDPDKYEVCPKCKEIFEFALDFRS